MLIHRSDVFLSSVYNFTSRVKYREKREVTYLSFNIEAVLYQKIVLLKIYEQIFVVIKNLFKRDM